MGLSHWLQCCTLLFHVTVSCALLTSTDPPTVVTGSGEVTGVVEVVTLAGTDQPGKVAIFKGVPYAQPPVGTLRFAKPLPAANLPSRFNATEYGPSCPQKPKPGMVMNEDCLYLNIFLPLTDPPGSLPAGPADNPTEPPANASDVPLSPEPVSPTSTETPSTSSNATLKAVLVWIHGGAFIQGSGRGNAQTLSFFGDVLVVSINYRLGLFGFFSVEGDTDVTGNQGLYDQHLALKWVKDNIRDYGGDPERITLIGSSAGGMSLSYQAMYRGNEGIVRRFIANSGTSLSPAAYLSRKRGQGVSRQLALQMGCLTGGKPDVGCLQKKETTPLLKASLAMMVTNVSFLSWAPVEDGAMVHTPAALSLLPGLNTSLQAVDAMIGTSSADGSVGWDLFVKPLAQSLNLSLTGGVSEDFFRTEVQRLVNTEDAYPSSSSSSSSSSSPSISAVLSAAVLHEYNNWNNMTDSGQLARNLLAIITDYNFLVPGMAIADFHSRGPSSTYVFLFDTDAVSVSSAYPWMRGAPHGAYGKYVAGLLGRHLNLSKADDLRQWNLATAFMTYVSNFAKTGNPNAPSQVKQEWPAYDTKLQTSLFINDNGDIQSRMRAKAKTAQFWMDYFPLLARAQQGESRAPSVCPNVHVSSRSDLAIIPSFNLFLITVFFTVFAAI